MGERKRETPWRLAAAVINLKEPVQHTGKAMSKLNRGDIVTVVRQKPDWTTPDGKVVTFAPKGQYQFIGWKRVKDGPNKGQKAWRKTESGGVVCSIYVAPKGADLSDLKGGEFLLTDTFCLERDKDSKAKAPAPAKTVKLSPDTKRMDKLEAMVAQQGETLAKITELLGQLTS